MSFIDNYLSQNKHFVGENTVDVLSIYPAGGICVLTCLDPRTDPAAFLEIALGDAAVIRNAGGRVTKTVIDDLALITYLSETKLKPGDSPLFEVVVIHHNKCGTHFLADPEFRRPFAETAGLAEADLIEEAVVDPSATVAKDVELLLQSNVLSRRISVSGHVYDVDSGTVTTVVPTTPMPTRAT